MWFSSVKAYHFNSIKVRLERKANGVATLDGKFQFHKGAIRTVMSRLIIKLLLYFNSIKVRLELLMISFILVWLIISIP